MSGVFVCRIMPVVFFSVMCTQAALGQEKTDSTQVSSYSGQDPSGIESVVEQNVQDFVITRSKK